MAGFVLAGFASDGGPDARTIVQVTGQGRTERRILLRFVRYGVSTQPAFSVRGSSRRITIMRFRPADIRVINRRICRLRRYPLCRPPTSLLERKTQPGST